MSDSKKGAQVRTLLDTAESYEAGGNPEAARLYRTKAEELMVKYRIELEEAIAHDEAKESPISREFDLVGYGSTYRSHYHVIWYHIAKHCEVRSWEKYVYSEKGYKLVAYVVGYETDLEYAEMLFTAARLVFMEKLEPKVLPELTDQENVYRLRSAGLERIRIAEIMWGNTDKVFLARVGRLYKAECDNRGEEAMLSGRGVTGKAFREQYADQFCTTLNSRLWSARQSASATGVGVVMHGRQERVQEAFYTFYPDQRPKPALPQPEEQPCPKCKAAKSGECREHKVPMGRRSQYVADYNSVAAERGRIAGRAAAREVGINRNPGTREVGA